MENKKKVISDILDYIDSNLTEDIRVDDIAGKFYFNSQYLMKMFKRVTGVTITQYVNFQKVKNSMVALSSTDDRILKIAFNNGFHSSEYYSETFGRIVGVSPQDFRKKGYSPISQEEGEQNMNETRLERIERNILELKKLREEILGVDSKKEPPFSQKNTTKPKLRVLRRETQERKAA